MKVGNYFDGNYFYNLVTSLCMPFVFDIGKIILTLCLIQAFLIIMRADVKGCITKVKYAVFGYILLKFVNVFIVIIDTIALQMTSNM